MQYIKMKIFKNNKISEIKNSRLVLGTGSFYQQDNEQSFVLLDSFLEIGGNLIDTAHQYVGSEQTIGKWMEIRKNREKIHIMTKGAHPDDGEPGNRLNPKAITKDLMESLERLKTEYIDLYALHRDDRSQEVGPIIEVLNEHIVAGRIHAIGTSNWEHGRIEEANEYALANGLIGFTFNSPNLSLAKCNVPRWAGSVSINAEGCKWHKENQMPLLSWSSQAGGFFTGRFSPDNLEDEEMVEVYYSPENWERYRRTNLLAKEKGVTPIQIALAYVLNQPFPTAAIIGPQNSEELMDSVRGGRIKLSEKEMTFLNLLD